MPSARGARDTLRFRLRAPVRDEGDDENPPKRRDHEADSCPTEPFEGGGEVQCHARDHRCVLLAAWPAVVRIRRPLPSRQNGRDTGRGWEVVPGRKRDIGLPVVGMAACRAKGVPTPERREAQCRSRLQQFAHFASLTSRHLAFRVLRSPSWHYKSGISVAREALGEPICSSRRGSSASGSTTSVLWIRRGRGGTPRSCARPSPAARRSSTASTRRSCTGWRASFCACGDEVDAEAAFPCGPRSGPLAERPWLGRRGSVRVDAPRLRCPAGWIAGRRSPRRAVPHVLARQLLTQSGMTNLPPIGPLATASVPLASTIVVIGPPVVLVAGLALGVLVTALCVRALLARRERGGMRAESRAHAPEAAVPCAAGARR